MPRKLVGIQPPKNQSPISIACKCGGRRITRGKEVLIAFTLAEFGAFVQAIKKGRSHD